MKVFLGGTCNESDWRERLIPMLTVDYFNPVVEDWTPECMAEELRQRESCDFCLYVITPRMTGVYSVAEVVDDSNKRPGQTIFCVLDTDGPLEFTIAQRKSLASVERMVAKNGAYVVPSLRAVAHGLTTRSKMDEVIASPVEGTGEMEGNSVPGM